MNNLSIILLGALALFFAASLVVSFPLPQWAKKSIWPRVAWWILVTIPFAFFAHGIQDKFWQGADPDQHLNLVWFFFGLLIICVLFGNLASYLVGHLNSRVEARGLYIEIFGRTIPINSKVRLFVWIWYLIFTLTFLTKFVDHIVYDIVSDGFYSSWVSDVIFFSIAGLAIAIVSVRDPQREDFNTRLQILFAGSKGPALDAIAKDVRALGFVTKSVFKSIEVVDYNQKYEAYRCVVTTTSVLENLFGDTQAIDKMHIGCTPDKFSAAKKPPSFGAITSILVEGEATDRLTEPRELEIGGTYLDEEFTVEGSRPKKFVTRYWTWMKVGQDHNNKPNRFVEEMHTEMINRVQNTEVDNVVVATSEDNQQTYDISYGDVQQLDHRQSIIAGEKQWIFRLLEPRMKDKKTLD